MCVVIGVHICMQKGLYEGTIAQWSMTCVSGWWTISGCEFLFFLVFLGVSDDVLLIYSEKKKKQRF